jgi:hypothetical protein
LVLLERSRPPAPPPCRAVSPRSTPHGSVYPLMD